MLSLYTFQLLEEGEFNRFYPEICSQLPISVQQKVDTFRFPADKQRSLMGDLMVRKFYSQKLNQNPKEIDFEYTEHQKPLLKNVDGEYFNISHSGNYVVVAFSDKPVGIDVELIKKDRRNIAERFFTPSEIIDMNAAGTEEEQIKYFYQLWTLKESYMKAIGDGLTMSLSSFSFAKNEEGYYLSKSKYGSDWFFHSQEWNGDAFLSICSKYPQIQNQSPFEIELARKLFTSSA
ncbi:MULTISPECIES: 4'-phosphopantetheinyl transferase superfamily protein [unclassified Lentimicrobium]|uniref:4'-phosphopantetheinyl transferase family protein n=1 Tax=unclassified Lentimicrobium TaxID=2677434 RepID=UPI001555DBA8|nr:MULTISPECIES: 4'-phosphopantetheinyl transferase superfamily protein [unclassified Lentimicrobium]NPD46264.1 4'-phosphopantetheinyl transferase superfamily protein [Lentimicrobium sp. S6]NPD83968.1 4'-phosphopantetheinyl transferase superfamily protein [Lentimicrobium sp. L6]